MSEMRKMSGQSRRSSFPVSSELAGNNACQILFNNHVGSFIKDVEFELRLL